MCGIKWLLLSHLSKNQVTQIAEEKYPLPCDPCPSGVRGTSEHMGMAFVVIVDKASSSGDTYPVDRERRPKGRQCLSRETQKGVAGRSLEMQEERPDVFLERVEKALGAGETLTAQTERNC